MADDAVVTERSPAEVPPLARAVIDALTNPAAVPAKLLISGGVGTGKTTVLAAARDALCRGLGGDRPTNGRLRKRSCLCAAASAVR